MSPSKKPAKKASVKAQKAPETKVEKKEPLFIKKIMKRSGQIVDFDLDRVVNAIHKAMQSSGEGSYAEAEIVATKVYSDLVRISKKYKTFIPSVEGIQDTVENELILSEYIKTAKSYILYRA